MKCRAAAAISFAVALLARLASADVVEGDLGKRLDATLAKKAAEGFSGAALVERQGTIHLAKGYGLADRGRNTPFTAETVFDVGSITKQFTATAVLHLERSDKLRLSDPISKHFPGVPPDKTSMTVFQLLTHTAGLIDGLGDDYDEISRDQLIAGAMTSKLLWPPGTKYRYSNLGYSLLAAIVEQISGRPYEDFLRTEFFLPAEMTSTGYRAPDWTKSTMARGVDRKGGDWGTPMDHRWAADGPWWNLRGNGGMLSTVLDLHRWHRELKSKGVLSSGVREMLHRSLVDESVSGKTKYGFGWSFETTSRGTRLMSHNGSNGIFFADFRRYLDDDVVVIVASNDARFSAARIEQPALNIVFPK